MILFLSRACRSNSEEGCNSPSGVFGYRMPLPCLLIAPPTATCLVPTNVTTGNISRSALGVLRWLSWIACVHSIGAATVVGDVVVRVRGLSLGSFAGRSLEAIWRRTSSCTSIGSSASTSSEISLASTSPKTADGLNEDSTGQGGDFLLLVLCLQNQRQRFSLEYPRHHRTRFRWLLKAASARPWLAVCPAAVRRKSASNSRGLPNRSCRV